MARRRIVRNPITDSERIRVALLVENGGWHYRLIAKRLYGKGKPNYVPSATEISRIGRIANEEGVSSRDWRNGETKESRQLLNNLLRQPDDQRFSLRLVAAG